MPSKCSDHHNPDAVQVQWSPQPWCRPSVVITTTLMPSKCSDHHNPDTVQVQWSQQQWQEMCECVCVHAQEFITIWVCNSYMVSSTPTIWTVSCAFSKLCTVIFFTLQDCVISGNFFSVQVHITSPPDTNTRENQPNFTVHNHHTNGSHHRQNRWEESHILLW